MTIDLNPEQERVIGQAIQAGVICAASDVLDVGIETIRQQLEMRLASQTSLDAEQWSQAFHAWVQGHSTLTPLLSDEAVSRSAPS